MPHTPWSRYYNSVKFGDGDEAYASSQVEAQKIVDRHNAAVAALMPPSGEMTTAEAQAIVDSHLKPYSINERVLRMTRHHMIDDPTDRSSVSLYDAVKAIIEESKR